MSTILNRFDTLCHNEFTINRSELETIKSIYWCNCIVIQEIADSIKVKQISGKRNVAHLQTPFDDLLNNSIGFDGVRLFAQDIHRSFMMIVRTRDEFALTIWAMQQKECLAMLYQLLRSTIILFSLFTALCYIKSRLFMEKVFSKTLFKNPMTPPSCSPILNKYLELPKTSYVNRGKITCELDIWSSRDPKDEYTYHILIYQR